MEHLYTCITYLQINNSGRSTLRVHTYTYSNTRTYSLRLNFSVIYTCMYINLRNAQSTYTSIATELAILDTHYFSSNRTCCTCSSVNLCSSKRTGIIDDVDSIGNAMEGTVLASCIQNNHGACISRMDIVLVTLV